MKNYKFYNNSIYHFPDPLYPGHPHTIWLLLGTTTSLQPFSLPLRLTRSQTTLKSGTTPDILGIEVDYLWSPSLPPPFESPPKLQNCSLGTATTFQQCSLFWGLTNPQLVFHKRLSCLHSWLRETGLGIQQDFAGLGASSCPVWHWDPQPVHNTRENFVPNFLTKSLKLPDCSW